MSYTKSTPSLDDLEPGLYYRNLPLRTEPLHKSAKSLMAVYEKDEYGEWSTYRGRGIPDCDAEEVALHHLAEYHERGGLFRLSFSATPTNGVGSMTTYKPGDKVTITLNPEYAKESSLMAAPAAVFEATYEGKTSVEDAHRVTYVNRHGEPVSHIVFDDEVSAA